jgi:glucose/arabinose dehydrogenase
VHFSASRVAFTTLADYIFTWDSGVELEEGNMAVFSKVSCMGIIGLAVFLMGMAGAVEKPSEVPVSESPLRKEVMAGGLTHPWSIAFLPDGRKLVTERPGTLRLVSADWTLSPPLAGLPEVYAQGQGGLLDVALDPGFAENHLVYLSFSEKGPGRTNRTAVARGKLEDNSLREVETIFRQSPPVESQAHFGSRLVFDSKGSLFVTLGDRFVRRYDAQNLENELGKIVRLTHEGKIPQDNPFANMGSPVFSYGHRNVQGAATNPASGELWVSEHGPQGGDEINIVRAGKNYGWPVVTYGAEYVTGAKIGQGVRKEGMEDGVRVWVPSIAPSGMVFYTGDRYPGWKGNLFVAALRGEMLVRLTLEGDKVTAEERLIPDPARRIRDVRQGPDGWLYAITDEESGEIWRILP